MHTSLLHRSETNLFSQQQLDLTYHQDKFKPFINRPFSLKNFGLQIKEKESSFSKEQRLLLVAQLNEQYDGIFRSSQLNENIELLKNENTNATTTKIDNILRLPIILTSHLFVVVKQHFRVLFLLISVSFISFICR